MHAQPDAARFAQLMELARELLQPDDHQEILVIAVDQRDAEAIRANYEIDEPAAPEEGEGNVVPLFGQPHLEAEDERRAQRKQTAEVLLELAERAERGEIREIALVAGVENNERFLNNVETIITPDVMMHLPMFLGGLTLLREHIMDAYALGYDPDCGEDEDDG